MTSTTPLPVVLRAAEAADAPAIHELVEAAYRGAGGASGWTTEAHLLDGTRTTEAEILANVADPASVVLVAVSGEGARAGAAPREAPDGTPAIAPGRVLGTVHLRRTEDHAELGMFAVSPLAQSRGIGSTLVRAADDLVRERWGLTRLRLTVVGQRQDLIDWYQRLGFAPTGEVEPFPGGATSTPLVDHIEMRVLERTLPTV
jgi:ribosomal protein S18 acetylase RimI-like enzyme